MKTLQNFGMVTPGANVRNVPFHAFSYKSWDSSKTYSFFSGGISATQNASFPNSDDQIIVVNEIGLSGFEGYLSSNSYLTITKNDKVICKFSAQELCSKNISFTHAGGSYIEKKNKYKKLLNPIIINGNDNIKFNAFINANGVNPVLYLRGEKFNKLSAFSFDERKNKNIEKNDFTLFHYKTIATGNNLLFINEPTEANYSKLLPLGSRESFVLNALEIAGTANLASEVDIITAAQEMDSYTNELKILVNNTEIFRTSDVEVNSYLFNLSASYLATHYREGGIILPKPIVIPSNSSIDVIYTAGARTKAFTSTLFMLKGELIKEVS